MSMSLTTQSTLAAQNYVQQFMTLAEEEFVETLADDVVSIHARMRGGFEFDKEEIRGKEAVEKVYHDNFFAITSNFELQKVEYTGFGLHAVVSCTVKEDKIDPDMIKRRYHMVCETQLDFKLDENSKFKIVKIWERTSKDLI